MSRVLDSNVLIRFWRRQQRRTGVATPDETTAKEWAAALKRSYGPIAILSVVYLEFLGGSARRAETTAYRAFLDEFEVADGWSIDDRDLESARRLAARVPSDRRPRGAMDCLISATASRLRMEVITADGGMPSA